jgi:hypothetical protein
MPWIIDYGIVLEQMRQQRLRCHYYNSGAFGFAEDSAVKHVGWIGPPDSTIREAVQPLVRHVPPPYEQNLAGMLVRAWQEQLRGRVWFMPKSHWAHELEHGSRDWMPALLEHVGVDPGQLHDRTNAAAIEFADEEAQLVGHFSQRLLEMLQGSDFMIAFPRRPVLCTLHHHKQVWWSSTDLAVVGELEKACER